MEENNNLQDILLDKNEEEKSGGIRKILIGVALLVIIFVVVLIVVKFLNSNDTKKVNDISDSLLLPAELPANTSDNSGSNDLFEQVPIVSDNSNSKESFENIVNEYKNAQAAMDTLRGLHDVAQNFSTNVVDEQGNILKDDKGNDRVANFTLNFSLLLKVDTFLFKNETLSPTIFNDFAIRSKVY